MKKLSIVFVLLLSVIIAPTASGAKPKCTKQQLVSLNQLAIDFNDSRSYFLKYVVYVNEANAGLVRSRRAGDSVNEALFRDSFSTASTKAKEAGAKGKSIEKQIRTLLGKCASGYGVSHTSDYGFLQMNASIKGVSFPSYFIPSVSVQPVAVPSSSPESNLCASSSCMPETWGNFQSIAAAVGGPVHEAADYSSDLMVYCSKRGTGSFAVSNARIVMAFTASTSWRKNYLSTPMENDFFQKDSIIRDASLEMKYFDVPTNVARYDRTPLSSEYKTIQYIPATTLRSHICETNVPFISGVDRRISSKIAGVGFFYLATMSDGRTLMFFLSGFDAQIFMKPQFTASFSSSDNQITFSGKTFGVFALSGGRDVWNSPSSYFGSICFRIDGVEDQILFPCLKFNSYWGDISTRNDFSGTLNVSSLSAGTHTLEMYIPTAPDKEISTAQYIFTTTG